MPARSMSPSRSTGGPPRCRVRSHTRRLRRARCRQVTAFATQGSQLGSPQGGFVEAGDEIVVTATVLTPDTPLDRLTLEWSADKGTITGNWRLGSLEGAGARTARDVPDECDADAENHQVGRRGPVVSDGFNHQRDRQHLGYRSRFDQGSVGPVGAVPGGLLELDHARPASGAQLLGRVPGQVERAGRRSEQPESVHHLQPHDLPAEFGDDQLSEGCAISGAGLATPASRCRCTGIRLRISNKQTETTIGIDYLSAVYRDAKWWLCDSDFGNYTIQYPGLPAFKK